MTSLIFKSTAIIEHHLFFKVHLNVFFTCKDDSIEIKSEALRKDLLPEIVFTISAHQTIPPSKSELRILWENFLPSPPSFRVHIGKTFQRTNFKKLSTDF